MSWLCGYQSLGLYSLLNTHIIVIVIEFIYFNKKIWEYRNEKGQENLYKLGSTCTGPGVESFAGNTGGTS